jgi:hypothetical protein
MKNTYTFLFFLFGSAAYAQLPSLIIGAGKEVRLPARTYQYSSIDIKAGGKLIIEPNSQSWCILYCTGNVTVTGTIIYRNFYSTKELVSAVTPDGTNLSYNFKASNLGGEGGLGGEAAASAMPRISGGVGAVGSTEYGGGGGAGGASRGYPNKYSVVGNVGDRYHGGRRQIGYDGEGGDGGIRSSFCNGGLLYIYCAGNFSGYGGDVHLDGDAGEDGKNGTVVAGANSAYSGGGGGGGAPGGEGGKLIVMTKGSYLSYPTLFLNGGKGGNGGLGMNNAYGNRHIPPLRAGENGRPGESGISGSVDYQK